MKDSPNTSQKKQIPSSQSPPTQSTPKGSSDQSDSFESYQKVAETVGMLPSLRIKDNAVQAIVVVLTTGIGAIIGF